MSFPPQFLDEIRARLPASEIIGRSVRLTHRGREHSGLCPFHKEKTPSFTVNDDKAFFHCFGCGAHGDVIGFVMQNEGVAFPEAVERLAGEAGLAMPERTPESEARAQRQAGLYEIVEKAADWFHRGLARDDGAKARAYLADRGLDQAVIDRFGLGWAPDRRGALKAFLTGEGVSQEQAVAAGLLRVPDDGEPYDFFRGRVIFPIADGRGRVVAFGGRTLGDGQPKYINSAENDLFHKGRTLYNLAAARRPARDAGSVIIAEGYMDVIAFARAGLDHAVAPLGTALTEEQLTVVWRLAAEPVLCLDGDNAGRRAAARAAERALPLLTPGKSLRFVFLPQGEDPDSLLAQEGAGALAGRIDGAQPLVEVLWHQAISGRRLDTPERRAGLRQALDAQVATIKDPSVLALYKSEFRKRFDENYGSTSRAKRGRQRADRHGNRAGPSSTQAVSWSGQSAGFRLNSNPRERIMLVCLLNHPALLEPYAEELAALHFSSPEYDSIRGAIADVAADGGDFDREGLRAALSERGFGRDIGKLTSTAGWDGSHVALAYARPEASDQEAHDGFRHLAARHRRAALEDDLRAAEAALAEAMSEEALAHLAALRHQLDDMDK
jgi:DNA primase